MADTKLSALTALAAAAATADLIEVLDVSDTTMAASGTNKKLLLSELVTWLNANGIMVVDGSVTNTKLATAAANTLKMNNTAGVASPTDVTIANAQTALAIPALPVTVANGGSGRSTDTSAYGLITAGTTATGAHQTVTPAASGFLKTTSTTVLPAWAAIASTDVSGLGALATKSTIASADITDGVVSNADLTTMATNTLKGNNTGGTAAPLDLNVAQVQALLSILVSSETVVGQVQLATAAQTLTGTSTALAVHPAGVIPLANSGPMFGFLFDTTTTTGTSTNGLRLNNATPASATIVYVNYTSRSGVEIKTRLLAGTAGDRLYIQDRGNSGVYRVYELTGAPTDVTTYASIPVVHRTGAGSLWANGLSIVAGFTTPPITVGTSAPASPLTNDLWIDTT